MPTYEYQCPDEDCREAFEVTKSIMDDGPEACPKCGHSPCTRLISSGTSFQLKGSGWSDTGYA